MGRWCSEGRPRTGSEWSLTLAVRGRSCARRWLSESAPDCCETIDGGGLLVTKGSARPRGRAGIETSWSAHATMSAPAAPVHMDGRGLKPVDPSITAGMDGRGLKQGSGRAHTGAGLAASIQLGERGLKQPSGHPAVRPLGQRLSTRAGGGLHAVLRCDSGFAGGARTEEIRTSCCSSGCRDVAAY